MVVTEELHMEWVLGVIQGEEDVLSATRSHMLITKDIR